MKRFVRGLVFGMALLSLGLLPIAQAEVTISITLTGSIEEILPILQQLQGLGIGVSGQDPLKLNVHSVMGAEAGQTPAEPAPAPEAAPPPPPPLGFTGVVVAPSAAKVGETMTFTATLSDPDHVVDTVAITVGELKFDLFDNGANGDVTAMDGTWSRAYELPATLTAGTHTGAIQAYDVNGEPVMLKEEGKDPAPLTTELSFSVTE
ncbi:MAG: hypothetical protein IT364_19630 [Candidatus Hydrogenedentes bacterium]|nr:hypothetical protein [Candidatus Hydrogenedentota bacterium]